ncbi:MAG: iron ABC transporter permease [Alistipes sp.]|nr:iron ABC transporter permease [Alistipes sp.]
MKKTRVIAAFGGLIFGLLLFVFFNISMGSVSVSPAETFRILTGSLENETIYNILWKIRLPRMCAAAILGGGLAVSGFLLQTYFNNPIAGPYILGISSGAKLFVALAMIFVMGRGNMASSGFLILTAFTGAMASMGFILLLSGKVRRASTLIIGGVMIGYICSAVTDFVVTFADEHDIVNLRNWSMGSFSGMSWENVKVMSLAVLVSVVIVFCLSKPIGAYQLGETYAKSMGVDIKVFRIVIVVMASFLAACVTAFAGPISFVGIAVPHLVKMLLKTSKPLVVIPACFLGGAMFCLGCDLIARVAFAPAVLNISSVTAIFGAPIVIAMLVRKKDGVR